MELLLSASLHVAQKTDYRELDSAMERRLEEMERRLKEHVDRRLDALEQKLEKALLGALQQEGGGSAPPGPFEQTGPTAATP